MSVVPCRDWDCWCMSAHFHSTKWCFSPRVCFESRVWSQARAFASPPWLLFALIVCKGLSSAIVGCMVQTPPLWVPSACVVARCCVLACVRVGSCCSQDVSKPSIGMGLNQKSYTVISGFVLAPCAQQWAHRVARMSAACMARLVGPEL
jgi:hypothetical protein